MRIGVDASRAFLPKRTGVEEYAYRVIKNLKEALPADTEVVLYVKKGMKKRILSGRVGRKIGDNWNVREIGWGRLWTQGWLAWELWKHPVDVLFVPAHTVPWIHPKRTFVVVHGLEYEFCPKAYSFLGRWYMRISIVLSCRWAWRVITVSESTKKDLMRLYRVSEKKILVIYEGTLKKRRKKGGRNGEFEERKNFQFSNSKFLLFVGRIEERKNVGRIVRAFEILKERYDIPHILVLAGKSGYGDRDVLKAIEKSDSKKDIVKLGYVSEREKRALLECADALVFPSLYEGFGLPILEAQAMGVPVITSNLSSMPEVAGKGAVLVDPNDAKAIANGVFEIISNESKRERLISMGRENGKRFSWEKCAREIAEVMVKDGE